MAKDVKIRITADDRSKRGIDSAKRNLKQLGRVAVSVGRAVGRTLGSIARGVRNIAVAGATAVTAFGVSAVNTARNAEEVRNKFNAVFKEIADDARKWAGDFGKSVNRATIDVERMLAAVQDLFVPLGFSRKEASAFSKEVAKLTVDIASFNNKADDDVLRDLQSALVGNSETVRKYGIILTEATIAEEAVRLGMAKTTKEVSNQAKVMARLSLIKQGSKDADGDAIRTAGSLTNVLKGLRASYKTLQIEVGQQLIGGLNLGRTFSDLTTKVSAFTQKLRDTGAIKQFAADVMTKLAPVKDVLKGLFGGEEDRELAIGKIKSFGVQFGTSAFDYLLNKAIPLGIEIGKGIAEGMAKYVDEHGEKQERLISGAAERGQVNILERVFPATANLISGGSFEQKLKTSHEIALIDAVNRTTDAVDNLTVQ